MNNDKKVKIFRDPIHGYIEVKLDLCKDFIDTEIFQRLKYIEQTSMRVLYPSAHHERFTHSLGVFFLGKKLYESFIKNIESFDLCDKSIFDLIKQSFLIACLMHDCAHAPFSHTLEHEYDYKEKGKEQNYLDEKINEIIKDSEFINDYDDSPDPKEHEKLSSIILALHYKDKIEKNDADLILVIRMILGCKYYNNLNNEKRLKNHFIEMLNSNHIDVDKLDYIVRDTWASGINSIDIDLNRLLNAFSLKENASGNFDLVYKKSALSVLKNVIDARNYLFKWIYGHHKVVYHTNVLQDLLSNLAYYLYSDNKDIFYRQLFSIESFRKSITMKGTKHKIYLPTDGDILYLLKYYKNEVTGINDFLNRNHKKALWKTYEEYNQIFTLISPEKRDILSKRENTEKILNDHFQLDKDDEKIVLYNDKTTLRAIIQNSILIDLFPNKKELYSFETLFPYEKMTSISQKCFYIYVPEKLKDKRTDIIKKLKSIV